MGPEVAVGDRGAILLESVDGSRRVLEVVLRSHTETCYELTLDGPIAGDVERPVMVSFGEGPAQRLAPVLEYSHAGRILSVHTPATGIGPPTAALPRVTPSSCPAPCRSAESPPRPAAFDISSSGVAVETEFWHPPEFALGIPYRGSTVRVACRTVDAQATGAVVVVHAEFVENAASHPALVELIDLARRDFLDAQLFLVGRANDSIQPLR